MRPTIKAFLLSGVVAIVALFAVPNAAEAHPSHGRAWYYHHGYCPRPHGAYYYGRTYPRYYYAPGVEAYRYRPHYYYDYYYGYRPRGGVRVGPVDVWW